MTRGLFHPDRGYWEVIGDIDAALAVAPAGTVETGIRPNPWARWDGSRWIAGEQPPAPPPSLSPARFEWLLAYTGLGDVWDALEAELRLVDRAQFAAVRAQRRKSVYDLDATLSAVGTWREHAARFADGVDLSETAIRAAWTMAAEAQI